MLHIQEIIHFSCHIATSRLLHILQVSDYVGVLVLIHDTTMLATGEDGTDWVIILDDLIGRAKRACNNTQTFDYNFITHKFKSDINIDLWTSTLWLNVVFGVDKVGLDSLYTFLRRSLIPGSVDLNKNLNWWYSLQVSVYRITTSRHAILYHRVYNLVANLCTQNYRNKDSGAHQPI